MADDDYYIGTPIKQQQVGGYLTLTDEKYQQGSAGSKIVTHIRDIWVADKPHMEGGLTRQLNSVKLIQQDTEHTDGISRQREIRLGFSELGLGLHSDQMEYLCRMARDVFTDRVSGQCAAQIGIAREPEGGRYVYIKPKQHANVDVFNGLRYLHSELAAANMISAEAAIDIAPVLGIREPDIRAVFRDEISGGSLGVMNDRLDKLRGKQDERFDPHTGEIGKSQAVPSHVMLREGLEMEIIDGRGPQNENDLPDMIRR